jgi:hypothetical protein
MIMAFMLISISSASSALVNTSAGPYNISFDLNTTMNYTVAPQETVLLLNPNTTQHSVGILTSNSSWAGIAVFDQENLTDSTNTSDRTVLGLAMLAAYYTNVTVDDIVIDGKDGMLASGELPTGDMIYRAWYWLDSKSCECGPVSVGKAKVEVMSLYPQNVTDSLLDTLHVEAPAPANLTENVTAENVTAENITAENVTTENVTIENVTAENITAENIAAEDIALADETLSNETLAEGEVLADETPSENVTSANETAESAVLAAEDLSNLTSNATSNNETLNASINASATSENLTSA